MVREAARLKAPETSVTLKVFCSEMSTLLALCSSTSLSAGTSDTPSSTTLKVSMATFLTAFMAVSRPFLVCTRSACSSSAPHSWPRRSSSSAGGACSVSSFFSLPTLSTQAWMSLQAAAMAAWPASTACSICSSVRKSQKPSIMRMASSVPASTRSSFDSSISSAVGLTTGASAPGSQPTRTPATAFCSGISESASATPAAVMERASVARTPS